MEAVKEVNGNDLKLHLAVLVIISTLTLAHTFNPEIFTLSDAARYYILGQSIATGSGFITIWDVELLPESLLAPGYPLLIAFLSLIFEGGLITVKIVNGILFVGLICLLNIFFSGLVRQNRVVFVALIFSATNYFLLQYSSAMLTEIPYSFIAAAVLLMLIRSEDTGKDSIDRYFIMGTILSIASYFVRPIGVSLILAIIANELWHRRWRRFSFSLLTTAAAITPWVMRGIKLNGLSNYQIVVSKDSEYPNLIPAELSDYIHRVIVNISRYFFKDIPETMLPILSGKLESHIIIGALLGIILALIVVLGITGLKRARILISGYLIFYLGILMVFPYIFDAKRYALPLIPTLIVLAFVGLARITENIPRGKARTYSIAAAASLLFLTNGYKMNELQKSTELENPGKLRFIEAAIWARENLPDDAIVATLHRELFYLYSAKRVSIVPIITPYNPDITFLELLKQGTTHVMMDEMSSKLSEEYKYNVTKIMIPIFKRYSYAFEEVFPIDNKSNTAILRIIKDAKRDE